MEDKMIEEMAIIALKNTLSYTCAKQIAMNFYKQGYRKLPEDSVVLSKEEYEKLQNKLERYSEEREFVGKCLTDATLRCVELTNDFNDMLDSIYDLARKETAKKTIKWFKENSVCIPSDEDINEFAKQFGVEIKE